MRIYFSKTKETMEIRVIGHSAVCEIGLSVGK
jgi:hypothetical protein